MQKNQKELKPSYTLFGSKCNQRKKCTECDLPGQYIRAYPGTSEGNLISCDCQAMRGILPIEVMALWLATSETPDTLKD